LRRSLQLVPAVALLCVALSAGQQNQTAPSAERPPAQLIHSIKGPDLFRAYCAPCHGQDAMGAGPAAPALKTKVPNLTLLARNNGGQFPVAHVRESIMGEQVVVAHGSREMPVWGPVFHQVEGDMDWGNVRLENLVKYLESIQSNRSPHAPPLQAPEP
jgi:mono/diheme cytochrome c family protein